WELADDGVAVVTFDLKGEPVNKISAAVKQDLLATFEALEHDAAVRAVAFFSGKPEDFIAGADIEEFVRLTTAAGAQRLSAEGQVTLGRGAGFPNPAPPAAQGVGPPAEPLRPLGGGPPCVR